MAACVISSSVAQTNTITVSNTIAGSTPSLLGYNLGHFTDKGNGYDWFRYSGVKGARVFMSASELQSQTSPARGVVTSEAAFWDTIKKARALGATKSTYIRWSDFNYDYTSVSGNNDITFKYAFTQLRGLGVDILVNITASPGTFPITSTNDWAGKWELWQHYYAQAYLLSRDYDIRRFSMFNEPNNWSGMTESDWFQRLRICSDAVQKAIADVNAAKGKSLVPRIYAPNTANGKEKYNTSADTWGRDTILNRYLQLNGLAGSSWSPVTNTISVPWRLSHVYNYQKYSMLTDDDGSLTGYITDLNALKGFIAADLGAEALPPVALTEYNVRTGATYDTKTENQDTPSDYVALGANSVGLSANGAEELFLFKFGQTDSGGANYGVAKNGTHYVQNGAGTDNSYGGATKAAEVYRLFNKAAQGGRQRYAFLATSGAASTTTSGLWTLVTRDPASGCYYVFLANKKTSSIPLELDLSALGIPDGNPVILEEVGASSSGDATPVGNMAGGRIALGSIPRETVWLVSVPSTAAGLTSVSASEDAQLADGTGRNLAGALANPMSVRADGTPNGRKVALIKIPVSAGDLTNNRAFYLDMEIASTSATNAAQAHVYGVNESSWSDSSANWAAQTSFLRQNVGSGSQISNNVVINTAGSPVARMLGQVIASTNIPVRVAVDVTEFVKSRTNGFASFLVVQDHRWDYSADPLTNRVTGDIQPAGLLVTSREKDGGGPRLIGLSTGAPTNAPVVLANPADRYLDVGGSAVLSIGVDKSLPCTIQWKKDGVVIAGANATSLALSNVSLADAGVYTAEVTNAFGTTASAGATVAINAAPVLVRGLGNVVATVGDPVTLSADFSGYPPPAYVWRKGTTIITGATGSSYSFIAATDSAGSYSVTADNDSGTATSSATLTLEAAATGFLSVGSTNAGISENFDSLGKTTASGIDVTTNYLGWTNGEGWVGVDGWTNKPGWYAASDDNRSPFEGYRTLNYGNNNPSVPPPRSESGLFSGGSSSSFRERSLGALPWTNNRVFFGLRLQNNTGAPLQGFSVRYRMEQYSATTASNSGTKLLVACAVNPASIRSANFVNFATNAQIVSTNAYRRINGTNASNSGLRTNQIGDLAIAPGDSVVVRWEVSTTTAEPLAFAIDDLLITNFVPAVAPTITSQPVGTTNSEGQPASFSVAVAGGPAPSLQWFKDGSAITGATNPTYSIDHIVANDAGTYSVRAANIAGTNNSAAVPLVVTKPPVFAIHPAGRIVSSGINVSFLASASGVPVPKYQWQKDGTNIAGATFSDLTLTNVSVSDSGVYSVLAFNAAGTNSSDLALLSVTNTAPFTQWKGDKFGGNATNAVVSGDGADPDADGLPNVLEYALGLEPLLPEAGAFVTALEGGNLTIRYTRNPRATDVVTLAQSTHSLTNSASWTTNNVTETNLSISNNLEQWQATVPRSGRPAVFMRLKVEPAQQR